MGKIVYSSLVHKVKMANGLKDMLFRIAGDGYLQIELGTSQTFDLMDSFYLFKFTEEMEKRPKINGVIDYGFGFRTLMIRYDPTITSYKDLIPIFVDIDSNIGSIENVEFTVREVTFPVVFEDKVTARAIKYYVDNLGYTPDYVINNHNISYVAKYNGITVDELKQKITGTGWMVIHQLFYPGGPYQLPLDPRSALEAQKYNPARTFTPEGTLGLGGKCLYIYPMETPGGYQLLGRTIPIWQISQIHPDFNRSPAILKPKDIIYYKETTEDEILSIYNEVAKGSGSYRYRFKEKLFRLRDWIREYQNESVLSEVKRFEAVKEEAKKKLAR